MVDVDAILRPWWDRILADHGDLALFDAHTHIGDADPDGARQTPERLLAELARADARAAVFPLHEPDGYGPANDRVIEAAAGSGGRLVGFCRVDPHAPDPVGEARRCLAAGARGDQAAPARGALHAVRARGAQRRGPGPRAPRPVLIHAGRGIPALGRDTVRLSGEFTGARLILAHAAISDLAWIWRVLPDHPNLLIDTAWWDPADMIALFSLVPPANLLWASDSPYGLPLTSAVMHMRLAEQAGLEARALRSIAGAQLERILAGADPEPAGSPPGAARAIDPLLERAVSHLNQAIARLFARADAEEPVALAKLACAVGEDGRHADVFAAVLGLIELYEEHVEPPPPGVRYPEALRLLLAATTVARTPDVPLPDLPSAPPPTREEAER